MVENVERINWRTREEIKTKEKMEDLSQGTKQLLHAPITPPICILTSNSQSISLFKHQRTMEVDGDPRRKIESFSASLTASICLSVTQGGEKLWEWKYEPKCLQKTWIKTQIWHLSVDVARQPSSSSCVA